MRKVARGRWPLERARVLLTLAVAVLAGACGIGAGGMALPAQRPGEEYPGTRQEVRGTLAVAASGCYERLVVDSVPRFVVWPAGSQLDDRVRLPNGQVVAEGDLVVGTGAFTPKAALVAQGGYWANALKFCAQGDDEVLVLDTAAVDPDG